MFQAKPLSIPASQPPQMFTIDRFKGLNLSTFPTDIDQSESPDMLNMSLDSMTKPEKRCGYERVFPTSLGSGQVNGMFDFKKQEGTTVQLLHWGTNLYTQTGSNQPVQIYSGLANAKSRFFVYNDKCYILDGTNYVRTDGVTVVDVSSVAYIPTLTLGRAPTGGGTAYEQWNLLTPAFKDSFSSTGSATAYQLSLSNLDATAVSVTINGVAKVEGTDFTVNRTTGVVTFTAAPVAGTNNVIITAYKTQSGYANRIKQATGFQIFGGANDTRFFWYGNPNYPNWVQYSGLFDPTYAPELQYIKVGSDAGMIKGMALQYDTCLILKSWTPNDNLIWNMSFSLDASTGKVSFPIKPLNAEVGCLASGSVQLINNAPTILTDKGVYQVVASNVRDERNTQHISGNVDRAVDPNLKGLLQESGLSGAVTVDYEKKYILCVGAICYVYDYLLGEWYKWDNIPASCFLERGGYLYFGSNSTGLVYRILKPTDRNAYSDDGVAINAYWKSKEINFGSDAHQKLVQRVFFSLKPSSSSSADLYYITDKAASALITTKRIDLFSFTNMRFDPFSFLLSSFPQEAAAKVKAKKIGYFQVILKNDRLDESMGILSVSMLYDIQRLYKG